VELPLALDPGFPLRVRMRVDPDAGQPSATTFEVLQRADDRALLSATPHSGRQHQIRIHLAALGHPVLGDKLYQEDGRPYLAMIRDRLDQETLARLGHRRHALHAESLEFTHPRSGERMRIRAPLPLDLQELLRQR
jgi:23S rRNA pseudouridine1911/1915/1917 synthase